MEMRQEVNELGKKTEMGVTEIAEINKLIIIFLNNFWDKRC